MELTWYENSMEGGRTRILSCYLARKKRAAQNPDLANQR
jgi:hypothetical protein